MAWEGDLGTTGDVIKFNNTTLSDAQRPSNNSFDSRLSNFGTANSDRNPSYLNGFGVDMGRISANGVLCHTVKPIPLMTKMSIALEIPRSSPARIECEGIVVRCEPHAVGDDHFKVAILYTKIGEEDR